ncbi:MAG: 2-dehydropantoate 2-reductase [Planctomycetes bacterium]|nr:2-dehydropantoate 2-reductase [Planctomycetota bacterium]
MIGPGALGLLVGGLLMRAGREVVFVARDEGAAARLEAAGLTLRRGSERWELALDARSSAPEHAAAVLLCVKVRDTEAACEVARGVADAPVVVFQNGLGRGAAVAAALGAPERVIVALTREGATPGVGRREGLHAGRGSTTLAPLRPQSLALAREVAELLEGALDVELVGDLARAEWEKLGVNAAINALTAIARCPNGALLEVPELRDLAQRAALEASRCAEAGGVEGDWGPEATRARWEGVAQATAGNRSSALQDLEAGRVTEVSAINGALAERATELGVPAPVNGWLAQLVRGLEAISRGN